MAKLGHLRRQTDGAAVEALLTIIVNRRSSSSPIGFVFEVAERNNTREGKNVKPIRGFLCKVGEFPDIENILFACILASVFVSVRK